MSNLENPQSLMKLSMSVGLYTSKLTTGFWRVFGVTVFECVQKQRLEKVRWLIKE